MTHDRAPDDSAPDDSAPDRSAPDDRASDESARHESAPDEAREREREVLLAAGLVRCFEAFELPSRAPDESGWPYPRDVVDELVRQGLLADEGGPFLVPTGRGREVWQHLSARLRGVRLLELLAAVNLCVELDESVSDDGAFVRPGVADPRFQPPHTEEDAAQAGTEDMRLAVLGYLSGSVRERDDDGFRLALLLSLAEGRLTGETAWFDLAHGQALTELEERARTAYHPRDVSDDPRVIDDVLHHIYEAAVLERRRRTGEPLVCLTCAGEAPSTSLWCPPCEEAWFASLADSLV